MFGGISFGSFTLPVKPLNLFGVEPSVRVSVCVCVCVHFQLQFPYCLSRFSFNSHNAWMRFSRSSYVTLFVLGRVLVDICIACPFSLYRCGGSVEGMGGNNTAPV